MSLGSLARAALGNSLFPIVARGYRAVFVDLKKVVDCLPPFPPGSHLLDIGGGDGEMINLILTRNPGLQVTMLDLSARLGSFLKPELRERVVVLPGTSLERYASMPHAHPNFVLISDVVHHVPPASRAAFFEDLRTVLAGRGTVLIVKDLEPGHFRSLLSELADRYVSGDRNVELVGQERMAALVRKTFGAVALRDTDLFRVDKPNYAQIFTIEGAPSSASRPSAGAL
jgi:hypothetical protein